MREVAIIGIGQTIIAEQWDKSIREIAGEALIAALKDAGREEVDGIYVGNMLSGILANQENLGALAHRSQELLLVGVPCHVKNGRAACRALAAIEHLDWCSGSATCRIAPPARLA